MSRYFDLTRRRFVSGSAVTGAVVLGAWLAPARSLLAATAAADESGPVSEANLFVALQADGTVEITCHRSEMGQHTRTAIAQIIADEMEADWDRVVLAQAIGDQRYGDQNTDGSRSIRFNLQRLRVVGATVRLMLEQCAAEQWGVTVGTCKAQQHQVVHESGKQLDFAALVPCLADRIAPARGELSLKNRADWRYIGKGKPIVDMADILTGKAVFAADIRLPETVIAVIARPPVVLASPVSFNAEAARAVPGVIDVVRMPDLVENPVGFNALGGVAVLASNTWAALSGRDQLDIKWSESPNDGYDSASFRRELAAQNDKPGDIHRERGDIEQGLREAAVTMQADYYIPHLSHAPMEPPAATARFMDGKLEAWSCTQNPQADQKLIAGLLGVAEEDVTVHVTLLGGAFGRKSKPDFTAEAAWLARKSGRTVRVQWSREDDIRHDFYHTVSAQRLDGGLDDQGRLLALRQRSTFPTIMSTFQAGARKVGSEADQGLADLPLAIPYLRAETGRVSAHIRIGWKRSVANIYHCFAAQSFLAELAARAGRDHREFLLEAIGPDRIIDFSVEAPAYRNYGADYAAYPFDTARLKQVLRRATDMAGWGRKMPAGSGLGLAVHRSFLSYVATVVQVSVTPAGELSIPAVWVAIDAGTVVNTDSIINQLQGASIYSLSDALSSQITVTQGAVEQSNFHDYQVVRMQQSPPRIEVDIIASEAPPAGVGEPGTPLFAPALCNAIFNASGQRIRELPIAGQLTSAS